MPQELMVSPTLNKAVDSQKLSLSPRTCAQIVFPIEELCQGKCNNTKAVDSPSAPQSLKNCSQIISPNTIKAKL